MPNSTCSAAQAPATTTSQQPSPETCPRSGPMHLSPQHYTMLHEQSAISETVIRQRGYRSLTRPDDLRDLGFSKAQARMAPVLAIPLWDVHGQQTGWQIRPDSPRQGKDGKVFKYETPKGGRVSLDVHPSVQPLLGDPATPLWVTEGIRKGDSLVSHGACAIALMGGVWGFRGTNEHGGKIILPDWQHVALNNRLVYVAFDSDLATKSNVQAALNALYRFLRDRQARPGLVRWPEEFHQSKVGVDDFFAQGHTLEEVIAMVPPMGPLPPKPPTYHRNGPGPDTKEPALPWSDYTNTVALIRDYGANVRYCYPWKSWLVWTGTHWQRDTSGTVMQYAKATIKGLARQVETLPDDAATKLLAHIKASLSTAALEAMVRSARDEPGIPVQPEELDTDFWLLNCTNGTVDLRTGALRPHTQTDLLTKCLPLAYDPDAICPMWDAFLWRIMGGTRCQDDTEELWSGELENRSRADTRAQALIDFLRRALGYSLTGSTREQCLFILHGPTKTGKSTFLATLRALLGPYGMQADMRSFMHKDREEVRNDLADLAGSRMVCALESQEGQRLAEGLIKQLTGGVDQIKARFLFQEYFSFRPQFKVFLGTNHKPKIGTDDAIWERIRLIPFIVQIPKHERDKTLDEQLQTELPGILAWAVRGCLEWQGLKELQEPMAVIEATSTYHAEMDTIARFLEECCIPGSPDIAKVKATALASAYQGWCKRVSETPLSNNAFIADLEQRGYTRARGTANQYYWHGLGLVDTSDGRYD